MAIELSLVENDLSPKQIQSINVRTPKRYIYSRPGRGGKTFDYVPIGYFVKKLNYAFGFAGWDFEIVDQGIVQNQIWVKGKLVIKDKEGRTITKMQFGASEVKELKAGGMVSLGNDFKAASSDALKKCAALVGIASDVYYANEYKEIPTEVFTQIEDDKPATEAQIDMIKKLSIATGDELPTEDLTFSKAAGIVKALLKILETRKEKNA